MGVLSLSVPTTAETEWSMIADCEMKQVLLVNTSSTTGQSTSTTAAPNPNSANLGSPQTNQVTVDTGQNYTSTANLEAGNISGYTPPAVLNALPNASPNSDGGGAGPSQSDLLSPGQ